MAEPLTSIDGLQSAWVVDAHEVLAQAQERPVAAVQGLVLVVEAAMANAVEVEQVGESGRDGAWHVAKGREKGY